MWFTYYCSLSLFLPLFSPLHLTFFIVPLVLLPLQLFMLVFFIAVIPMWKTPQICHKCNHVLICYSIKSLEWCQEIARLQRNKTFFPERRRQTNALIRCLLPAQKVTILIGGTLKKKCQNSSSCFCQHNFTCHYFLLSLSFVLKSKTFWSANRVLLQKKE